MHKFILLLLTIGLFSCNATKPVATTDMSNQMSSLEGEWTLTTMNGAPIDRSMQLPTLALNMAKKRVSGNSSCNNFASTIEEVSADKIEMGEVSSTKMACPGPNVESDYFAALGEVATYRVEGSTLMLMNKKGKELLTFMRN